MNVELPKGWAKVPVDDLIDLNPRCSHPDDLEVGFVPMPLMGTKFCEPLRFEGRKWGNVKKGYTNFQDGDVLLAKITPCFENGKGGVARGLPNGVGAGSTEYFVCRPRLQSVVPEVLHAFVKSLEFMSNGATQMTGSVGHKRVTKDFLLNSLIPLAPLAEQKRIADKLELVLGRVDACRARLHRVPALLKRFRQSVLAAATSGRLTEEWKIDKNLPESTKKTLGDVIKVSSGKALTAKNMSANGTIPVFGGNGINGYHDQGNVRVETLVIGRVGYYCGCVHMTPEDAWITDNALIVRHDDSITSKYFLFYPLQALDLRTNDAATAQPVISGQKIYSLSLLLPPLPEQQEIVRRVEALFAFADRIEARLATAQRTVERLTPATLAKAFRGKLVPQDPRDEPASALLERLHSQPAAKPVKAKRAKRP